jgi:hypothetical protein
MSGDPDQEYFSDGITGEIITALSKTSKLAPNPVENFGLTQIFARKRLV